ncbi:MAG: RDD family protein [Bacillota bacterium]
MVKCPNCNYEAEAEFRFCPMCGYAFSEVKTENTGAPPANENTKKYTSPEVNKPYKIVNGLYEYPKAPLGKRFAAYLIDGLILFALSLPSIVLFSIGALMNPDPDAFENGDFSGINIVGGMVWLWGLFLLIIPSIYYFIKDGLKNGQSYGKRMFGLMVIDIQKNLPCSKGKSAFRNLISSLIVAMPFINILTFWIEPIMVLVRTDGKKAADMVASCQVIDAGDYAK